MGWLAFIILVSKEEKLQRKSGSLTALGGHIKHREFTARFDVVLGSSIQATTRFPVGTTRSMIPSI
jgi:hypothetical protein